MDITNTHLEAALLDQKVASLFAGQLYCFVAVVGVDGWQLGVAVANERGYAPIDGLTFVDRDEASTWSEGLNTHIGRTDDDVCAIICSTMGGRRVRVTE